MDPLTSLTTKGDSRVDEDIVLPMNEDPSLVPMTRRPPVGQIIRFGCVSIFRRW